MTAGSEYEAAYFTLLRAREEHRDLLAYEDFLGGEARRLRAVAVETRAGMEALPRRLRRPVDATSKQLLEAVGHRLRIVEEEQRRTVERIAAAQAFVEECEAELAALRG